MLLLAMGDIAESIPDRLHPRSRGVSTSALWIGTGAMDRGAQGPRRGRFRDRPGRISGDRIPPIIGGDVPSEQRTRWRHARERADNMKRGKDV